MTKSKRTTSRRRPSLLVLIGSILLLLIAVIVLVVLITRPDHGRDGPARIPGVSPESFLMFREDGLLTFSDSEGTQRTTISIEIADTEESRTQGLMGRTRMEEQQGMLFIFPTEEYRSFWMANTPLPLDIIFLDAQGVVVTIHRNTVPYSKESLPSSAPAKYVVEVNAGYCDRHDIRVGDSVSWLRR